MVQVSDNPSDSPCIVQGHFVRFLEIQNMANGSRMNPKEIRELMRLRGWSQRELARQLQVHEASVSRWLAGDIDVQGPCRVLMRYWLIEAREEVRGQPA
jgi:DNA-binding transcriptional regulator YiaG